MSLLKKGDTIGFVATSSGLENKNLTIAINYFEKELKLKVKLAPNLRHNYRYMAGSDAERAEALMNMYKDKDVKAIFSIRGGAGASRMLPLLDYNVIKKNPKPLFGLSDVTTVQNAILARTSVTCYTGFLPLFNFKSNKINSEMAENIKNVLFSPKHKITSGQAVVCGQTEGEIIGGCLTSFLYLAGSKYMPDFKDKILLLEDIGEKTYKIDLMLNQLKQQKNFAKLKGIILGKFTDCIIADKIDGDVEDCIKDFVSELNIPIIKNFGYGHIQNGCVLPLGIKTKLKTSTKECSLTW